MRLTIRHSAGTKNQVAHNRDEEVQAPNQPVYIEIYRPNKLDFETNGKGCGFKICKFRGCLIWLWSQVSEWRQSTLTNQPLCVWKPVVLINQYHLTSSRYPTSYGDEATSGNSKPWYGFVLSLSGGARSLFFCFHPSILAGAHLAGPGHSEECGVRRCLRLQPVSFVCSFSLFITDLTQ